MTRRVSLPGADELFRSTGPATASPPELDPTAPGGGPSRAEAEAAAADPSGYGLRPVPPVDERAHPARPRPGEARRPSGRERHEEKITVYCSAGELVDLERARLTLRADHALAVDRGRIVREALALVLSELEEKGAQSTLVRRLRA